MRRNAVVLNVAQEQIVRNPTQWKSEWGDFSRDVINARVLVIELRQLGPGNSQATVRWYFIGKDHDQGALFIYDSGTADGNIARGGVKLAASSQQLVQTREQIVGVRRTTTGQVPYGWCVFVEQDGRPLAEMGSVPEMIEWTRKELAGDTPKPPARSRRKVEFVPQALAGVRR